MCAHCYNFNFVFLKQISNKRKMSVNCRVCGEPIFHMNPRNLFKHENEDIRHNIYAITGLKLIYDRRLPEYICSCCYLDLNHAMAFRDRCLEANKQLSDLEQREIPRSKFNRTNNQQIDPLDGRDSSELEGKKEFDDEVHNREHGNQDVQNQSNHTSIEHRKSFEPDHLSPRVQVKRCRDPKIRINGKPLKVCMKYDGAFSRLAAEPTSVSFISKPAKRMIVCTDQKYSVAAHSNNRQKEKKPKENASSMEKKYVCDKCGWSFRDLSNMKDHALRHSGIKKFECEECSRKFFTRPLLMLHVRVHHNGEKPFVCKYCGVAFRNSPSRCRHERKYHAKELPFKCNICNRSFITKISLEKHQQAHIKGETIPRCETCKKTFKGPTYLKNHYLTKFHLRRINQIAKNDSDNSETMDISGEEIDFDFPDSIIEEIDD